MVAAIEADAVHLTKTWNVHRRAAEPPGPSLFRGSRFFRGGRYVGRLKQRRREQRASVSAAVMNIASVQRLDSTQREALISVYS